MRTIRLAILLGIIQWGLTGCATAPDKSELKPVSSADLRSTLLGNTFSSKHSWGMFAELYGSGGTSQAKAWGSGWSQLAKGEYTINSNGELCESYSNIQGAEKWAGSDNIYCGMMYTDTDGNYYYETTKNTHEPAKVGKMRKVDIISGDKYGLTK